MTSPEERVRVSQLSRRGPATLIAGLRTPGLAHVRAKKRRNKAVLEMRGFLRRVTVVLRVPHAIIYFAQSTVNFQAVRILPERIRLERAPYYEGLSEADKAW